MATKLIVKADGTTETRPFTAEEEAQAVIDAQNAAAAKAAADAETARLATFSGDADTIDLLDRLRTATNTQVDTWVDNNMTTLAEARAVLKKVIKVLVLLARRI